MTVAELFASLGLEVDEKGWAKGAESIKKLQGHLETMAEKANEAAKDTARALATIGLPKLTQPARAASKVTDKLTASLKGLVAGFVAMKTLSWGAGLVTDTLAVGDAAVKTGQKMGVTAEAVQELDYAAKASGTDIDGLRGGLTKLNLGMREAAKTGKGDAVEAIRGLGLSFKALNQLPLDQRLGKIADRFAAMPDGARKTALAMQLFGKSGGELIPFLNSGSKGIAELRNEARRLGVVIDNDSAKGMESLGDEIEKVKSSLVGIRNQAVIALMPTLKNLTERLLVWITANRQLIAQKVTAFVKGLASVMQALVTVLGYLGTAIAFVSEHWSTFSTLLKIAFLPFTLLIEVIKLVVKAILFFKDRADSVVRAVKGFFKGLWESIKSGARGLAGIFSGIVEVVLAPFRTIVKWIENRIENLIDAYEWIAGKVKSVAGSVFGEMPMVTEMRNRQSGITPGMTPAIAPATRPISNSKNNVMMTVGDIHITAPSGDAKAIGDETRKVVRDELGNMMRHSIAGVGGR